MEPLQTHPMPTSYVLVPLTAGNAWQSGSAGSYSYFAYVATDSDDPIAVVSLRSATEPDAVLRVAARQAYLVGYERGVVVELYVSQPLGVGDSVTVVLAQSGASMYFPPQPIED